MAAFDARAAEPEGESSAHAGGGDGAGSGGRILDPVRFDVPTATGSAPVDWLQLEGRFEQATRDLLAVRLGALFTRPGARVILDLSRVRAMSSSSAAVCILAVGTAEERRGRLVLLRPSEAVRECFDRLEVSPFLPIVESMPEALLRLIDMPAGPESLAPGARARLQIARPPRPATAPAPGRGSAPAR